MTIPTFNIESTADVRKFFSWLSANDLMIHPDDCFVYLLDFAAEEGELPTITIAQAEYLDEVMERCFYVCDDESTDIYELAQWH